MTGCPFHVLMLYRDGDGGMPGVTMQASGEKRAVKRGLGMSGHQHQVRGHSQEWHTPPEILAALGPFDDDPCLPGTTNGLTRSWKGFVWLNPPYDRDLGLWLDRLADHGNGIALIFARTETQAFYNCVWRRADAVLFLHGRLTFYQNGVRAKANAGAPSCLVAYGLTAVVRLARSQLKGALVTKWKAEKP